MKRSKKPKKDKAQAAASVEGETEANEHPEVAAVREQLQAAQAEAEEMRDKWLRSAAELDNFRKRSRREIDAARDQGKCDLAERLFDALDNLERALSSLSEEEKQSVLAQGVAMVNEQFLAALESCNIEALDSVGKSFDPHLHEALMQEPRDDVEPGTILAELVRGYRMGDKLIRASKVQVAQAAAPSEPKEEIENDSGHEEIPTSPETSGDKE